jgi:hypothetical protein
VLVRIKSFPSLLKTGQTLAGEKPLVFALGKKNSILVRTDDDAIPTPNTFVLVYGHDPVLAFIGCTRGTDLDTGGLLAMIASDRIARHNRWGAVLIGFHSHQSRPVTANRQKMLYPACDHTAVTPYTLR